MLPQSNFAKEQQVAQDHQCRGHKTDYGAFLLVAQLGNCVDPNPCNETVCS